MARQKTKKTATKRIKVTNPKGNRKSKMLYKKSAQHHLRTKRSSREKRRKLPREVVHKTIAKKLKKLKV
jgi:ribosomal protein L35